ncbi:MAG: formyltransferase family protein [Nanoarchaeota archaeon]|mgnify:CR=1 FL=1
MDLRLGFLASNNGSNARDIIEEIKSKRLEAKVKVIISENINAKILELAVAEKIISYRVNYDNRFEEKVAQILGNYDVNLVVFSGFLKKVDGTLLANYRNRILNIHPALLPKYGGKGMYGMKVHEAVIKSNDEYSGATVHVMKN